VAQVVISGLQVGSSYALMALAIVLVLKATDVPNWACCRRSSSGSSSMTST
jgi:branched-chain amino acid transport system permease protein